MREVSLRSPRNPMGLETLINWRFKMKYMMSISISVVLVLWSVLVVNHMCRGLDWMPLAVVWILLVFCTWSTYRLDSSQF